MGQVLMCRAVVPVPPPPLVADIIGSWPYVTVSQRMVSILRTVLTTVVRAEQTLAEMIGVSGREAVELVQKEVKGLLDSLTSNGQLTRLTGEEEDVNTWNAVLEASSVDGVTPRWHDGEWLYVECFMYRRLYDIVDTSAVLTDYDYFHTQKAQSFEKSIKAAYDLAVTLLEKVSMATQLSPAQVKETFMEFLMVCLWGNKNDLSLSGGLHVSQDESPLAQLPHLAKFLLVDDHLRIFNHLDRLRKRQKETRVDFICDNAGFELLADLCLADYLDACGLAQRVTFHVKAIPWFVSDTTHADVDWLLKRLERDRQGPALPALAARWRQQLSSGHWELADAPFWTSPFPFHRMRQECPSLYQQLQGADLILIKGDLNYRKLVGDRRWPVSTAFCRALEGFHPAPLAALRVLKADLAAGVPRKRARQAEELDRDWMTAGRFAVIQLCMHVTPLDVL